MNAFCNGFMGALGVLCCAVVCFFMFSYFQYQYGMEVLAWIIQNR